MLHPKVRQVLELLDPRFEQDGMLRYQALEEALEDAVQRGDERAESDLSLEMGVRLVSIATMAQATAQNGQAGGPFPNEADALEPAIDLLNRSLERAISLGDDKHEKGLRLPRRPWAIGGPIGESPRVWLPVPHLRHKTHSPVRPERPLPLGFRGFRPRSPVG